MVSPEKDVTCTAFPVTNVMSMHESLCLADYDNYIAVSRKNLMHRYHHEPILAKSLHLVKAVAFFNHSSHVRILQASKLDGCRVRLGDRPIQVTLRRALSSLSLWHKARLGWYLLTSKEPIRYH